MKANICILLLLLCLSLSGQELWQPVPILTTDGTAQLVAVELGRSQTCLTFRRLQPWTPSAEAYLSDERGHRHRLLRTEERGSDLLLYFDALPQATRLLDFEGGEGHRWMGIHSALRTIHFPPVRPRMDEHANLPDSIQTLLRANDLTALATTDSAYAAIQRQLPIFRDYIVWKWHLTPHQAFLLQRSQERHSPATASPPNHRGAEIRNESAPTQANRLPAHAEEIRSLPRAPKPSRRELKRFSRFEQKMLQEQRHPNP